MITLIRQRKSLREYVDAPISQESITILEEALLHAPTSRNRRPWHFWFITQKESIHLLSQSKVQGSQFLDRAPLIVVIGADEAISDVWIEDCAIAAAFLQLTAESLGIGSCWVQIRDRASSREGVSAECFVKEALSIVSPTFRIATIIGLGYPLHPGSENRRELPTNTVTDI